MECKYYLRNIQDKLSDGKTPYERRFGIPFDGPAIPSGAMVEYRISSAQKSYLGYALHAGEIWKGGIIVADIEELEEMDASEIHARRLNAKEVLTEMKGDNFKFPVADGTVKLSVGDRSLIPSTLTRERPERRTRNSSWKFI